MEQALQKGLISSYEKEYKLIDERGTLRKFDMFFTDINNIPYLVEMDGGRHSYIKQKHSNKKYCFVPARSLLVDDLKDKIATKMDITLIRIDCYKSDIDYIKNNIYKSIMSEIFDLDKIDWIKIEEICYGNIIEEVCRYKKDHPEAFAPDVCDMFDVSSTTLRKYWKIGNRLGLCEYHPETEGARRNSLPRNLSQCVGVYVENIDTGENWNFESKTDFCKESEDILDGDKMTKSMLEKRLSKTNDDYFIYDSGINEFLIWVSRRKK